MEEIPSRPTGWKSCYEQVDDARELRGRFKRYLDSSRGIPSPDWNEKKFSSWIKELQKNLSETIKKLGEHKENVRKIEKREKQRDEEEGRYHPQWQLYHDASFHDRHRVNHYNIWKQCEEKMILVYKDILKIIETGREKQEKETSKEEEKTECNVCFEEFPVSRTPHLPCRNPHDFRICSGCLKQLRDRSEGPPSCPVCRDPLGPTPPKRMS